MNPILMPVVPNSIVEALTAAIGIDPRALDPGRLKWIVAGRCRNLSLPHAEAYAAYLQAHPEELDALIDVVVVQETRFFRDPVVFDHIRIAVAHLASKFPGPLRILSAPCGTGQEAYSLAAMFALVGVPPQRFTVDAFDVSLSALEVARPGVYPEHALTHVSPELQHACGLRQEKRWQVHEHLRQRIRFERRNLAEPGALSQSSVILSAARSAESKDPDALDPSTAASGFQPVLPPFSGQYHLILCRNLFIYLHAEARTALSESLAGALIPGGRLVIGTADRVEELNALFSPVRPAASFAFTHRELAQPALIHPTKLGAPRLAPETWERSAAPGNAPPEPPPTPSRAMTASDLYHSAMELHRQGEVAKAERRCRQALYLAPSLLPALELLQSLWSRNPNVRLRRALRDRIVRTQLAAQIESQLEPKEFA